jgi:hypothetical protein
VKEGVEDAAAELPMLEHIDFEPRQLRSDGDFAKIKTALTAPRLAASAQAVVMRMRGATLLFSAAGLVSVLGAAPRCRIHLETIVFLSNVRSLDCPQ